ncbi:hypothetical protein [Bacillus sp. AK128]
MRSIDEEAVQILTTNLLDFMKGSTDEKIFSAYLFNQLTDLFETATVLEWFLDWARTEGK